ncbi:MAG: hypothetical protein ABIS92_16405, partial [Polyangia bacterium]
MRTPTPTPTMNPVASARDRVGRVTAGPTGKVKRESFSPSVDVVRPTGGSTPLDDFDWADAASAAGEDAEGRDGAVAQAHLFMAARLSEDRLGDSYAAYESLTTAVQRSAGAPSLLVLRALRELALDAGSTLAALECVDQEISATTAVERRADLLVEKAALSA